MRDLKYTAGYIIPLLCIAGIYYGGFWTYSAFIFAFVLIPLVEPLLAHSDRNLSEAEKQSKTGKVVFDWLLYLNLPLLWGILFYFLWSLENVNWSAGELTGLILSTGVVIGACGINVGHELGHRSSIKETTIAKLLLLPALYMHFYIEHNRGHHKNVATDKDPASARLNEDLYTFWFRSLIGSYINAWRLENRRLKKTGRPAFSIKNQMIWFHLAETGYLFGLYLYTDSFTFWPLIIAALVGILFLETINYIEHYGLRRSKRADGRYEKVKPHHSWNSNHELGRIVLYELTRHSDHHYIASKKYQLLDHHKATPQLPLGYPASMLMALIPPLWFHIMNRHLMEFQADNPDLKVTPITT